MNDNGPMWLAAYSVLAIILYALIVLIWSMT